MAVPALAGAPVLSTSDAHRFEDAIPAAHSASLPRLSDEQVALTYEIDRTIREIRIGRWRRIALQFPDHMLVDGPRVSGQLARGLAVARKDCHDHHATEPQLPLECDMPPTLARAAADKSEAEEEKIFILGDTSYGACCVDEVAAEHIDADVVVHYGRACLSPPSRMPVIYVFTERPLELDIVVKTFQQTYPSHDAKIILMADIPYSHHIPVLVARLHGFGYTNVFATEIVHNPSSALPNRTVPCETFGEDSLRDYALFHISDPPPALLLTISSRVASINIYPTDSVSTAIPTATLANTSKNLNRRYALLTSLSTTPVFGILINTLSVKNYMHILSHVKQQIADAGKKSYTFVVGKVNAAKVANFSEVGGWVVIGCWESSLIESKDFWRPMITAWELELALQQDEQRVWTGRWESDFQTVLDATKGMHDESRVQIGADEGREVPVEHRVKKHEDHQYGSEEESAPPEFDLRTGRYVSSSRPLRAGTTQQVTGTSKNDQTVAVSTALSKRAVGDIAAVGGVVSPGAEYLRSNRTWQGLGSDYRNEEEAHTSKVGHSSKLENGRRGIARGYTVGDEGNAH
ncbi:Diphthamide biosynthesis protein 2 [Coniothyrium glycines]